MATKTVHVYSVNGEWTVKKEGKRAETFGTKKEAVTIAIHRAKHASPAQIVVHGKNGQITEHRTYGLPAVQLPPKGRSAGARKIAKAVNKVVLDHLIAAAPAYRAHGLRGNDVFINCPFDRGYRPLLEAIVFAVHDVGLVARSALEEDDGGEVRLSKIAPSACSIRANFVACRGFNIRRTSFSSIPNRRVFGSRS